MSRMSNLLAAGVFIIFLAVLFHFFCKVRKKAPELIIQQRIQVPEACVYPIPSNANNSHAQVVLGRQFGQLHPSILSATNLPFPVRAIHAGQYGPYNFPANNSSSVPVGYSAGHNQTSSNTYYEQPEEDLPPPYHVAIASAPVPH